MSNQPYNDEADMERRRQRILAGRRRKRQADMIRGFLKIPSIPIGVTFLAVLLFYAMRSGDTKFYIIHTTQDTQLTHSYMHSEYAIILEQDTGEILAQKNAQRRINPASMTQILTALVAAEASYPAESGNCAASYAEDASGKGYICVTADADSFWHCLFDHAALYNQFLTLKE